MDAQALRNHLEASGFRLSVVPDGLRVEPASALTTETRQFIRANRDILIGLVRPRRATDKEAGQIFVGLKKLWARTGEADSPEFPEALEIALANPGAALASLRADGAL